MVPLPLIECNLFANSDLLSFKGYNLLIEKNDVKSRMGFYIRNEISYIRRNELEGLNNGIIESKKNLANF